MTPLVNVLRRALLVPLLVAVAAAQAAAPVRTVVRPVLNMHSSPSVDADVVSQAIYSTAVTILDEKGGWAKIRTPDDYTGWVESAALSARRGEPYAGGEKATVVQVRSLFAHVYREESVSRHAPLVTLPFETKLEVDGEPAKSADRWTAVRLPDGQRGLVQNGDIATASATLTIDDTIALAKRFLGLPYTWGGTSSFGYDCSGFTQMLVRQRGYAMPRDSKDQAVWNGSEAVERARLAAGDLLFFGSSPQRITHTGMYIGDGQFINATTHERPMVRIDDLNEPYWAKLLVAARRVKS